MSAAGVLHRMSCMLGTVTATALAYACISAPPAPAAVSDTCGLITEFELAKAFGLRDVVKHGTVVAAPGNPAGVVRHRCETFAWRGPKPTNEKRKRESLLEGTLARLNMQTWVPDEGPQAEAWRTRFDETLKRLRGAASDLFLEKLDGKRFLLPRFEAESRIGFSATVGRTQKVRVLWWSRGMKSLLVFDAVEAKGQPTIASVRQVASIVVSEVFRRP